MKKIVVLSACVLLAAGLPAIAQPVTDIQPEDEVVGAAGAGAAGGLTICGLFAVIGFGFVATVVLAAADMFPTFLAFSRRHPSKLAILIVNFFFGWTCIGWWIALVWALSATGRERDD